MFSESRPTTMAEAARRPQVMRDVLEGCAAVPAATPSRCGAPTTNVNPMPHRTHPLALFAASVLVLPAAAHAQEPVAWGPDLDFHTFSIAAIDPRTGESGVAVTTRRPCVGNAVPWVRSGIGAAGSRCARARPSRFRGTLW